ncbi:leucine efflux protein LeuE [Uliginosibacterium sp. 31-16]|uniref:leucine efflux protein LeuE n=1 Tax=Uliginosibacterium sp. 31-16 TaxID=3068315 RepID=UPI00273E10EB|nr:leucine efflux protein LeuE [Uliginosibacterium sp. 31-16]MDP5238809.1 leucine efflux protein LeuE [Uliginosibacterium sp. 31-16]
MFYGVTDIWTYALGALFIVLLPGPNSLYVMAVASREGVKAGYRGACGVFLGDTVLMIFSAAGAASLLKTHPALFMLVKYVGAAYLGWVGLGLLRQALANWRGKAGAAGGQAEEASRPFRRALIISLMNPKAILFFISFFIQFVDPQAAQPALAFLILGVILQVLSALYLSALIFGGAYLASQFRRRKRLAAAGTASVGGVFLGFGVKLATASLG